MKLLGLFRCLCMFPQMHCVPIMVLFFRAGRRIRVALLMFCEISAHDMITSRAMRVIWVMCIQCCFPTLTLGTASGSPLTDVPNLFWKSRILFPSFSSPFSPLGFLSQSLRIQNFSQMFRQTYSCCQLCPASSVLFTPCSEIQKRFLGGSFKDLP